jgi:protoheme IX farnesyltransferase
MGDEVVERRAAGGPEDNAAAGPWLRLVAIGASVATASVAASGSLGLAHRALVLAALPLLAALVAAAWVAYRSLLARATAAVGLFLVEVGTGAVAWLAPGYWASLLHVAFATAAFAATLLAAAAAFRGPAGRSGPWRDYVTLTKPRIMTLLLLTGAAGMFVGARGVPPLGDLTAMLLGLALACGGASALNHYLDRDIDRLMGKRTQARPVASGRVPPERALEFGLCLSAFSFVVLTSLANPLTAALALAGNLFYVVVYTGWLKRRTPQNIVIGGAAGAVPPLVGWSAATGDLTLPALFLFLVVFVWTPPHFWALALLIRKEYERAAVPMLPVVRGERETTRQILLYTAALVGLTFLPLAWAMFGLVYVVAATLLGAGFLAFAWRLRRSATPRRAAVLFHYSLVYLALLFVAMAIDPIVVA